MAELMPARMAIKPLALTKAMPDNTAILVDAQPTDFDIVILADGVAQPVRSVPFPEQAQTPEARLKMIIDDLDRTLKFFEANNPDKPLDAKVPLYVSGEMASSQDLQKALAEATKHPVKLLTSQLKGSEQLDPVRYMVSCALTIGTPLPTREPTFPAANLNVLPAPYRPKPMSMSRVVGIPGGAAVVALVVPMVIMMQNTSANISSLQDQLSNINQLTTEKLAQQKQLTRDVTDLQSQSVNVEKTYNSLKLSQDTLNINREIVNGDLKLLLSLVPSTINLTSINETTTKLVINGNSTGETDVLTYARSLDLSHRYVETSVTSLKVVPPEKGQTDSQGSVVFTLTLLRKG